MQRITSSLIAVWRSSSATTPRGGLDVEQHEVRLAVALDLVGEALEAPGLGLGDLALVRLRRSRWRWRPAHRPAPGSDPGAPGKHARTAARQRSFHLHADRWLIRGIAGPLRLSSFPHGGGEGAPIAEWAGMQARAAPQRFSHIAGVRLRKALHHPEDGQGHVGTTPGLAPNFTAAKDSSTYALRPCRAARRHLGDRQGGRGLARRRRRWPRPRPGPRRRAW